MPVLYKYIYIYIYMHIYSNVLFFVCIFVYLPVVSYVFVHLPITYLHNMCMYNKIYTQT